MSSQALPRTGKEREGSVLAGPSAAAASAAGTAAAFRPRGRSNSQQQAAAGPSTQGAATSTADGATAAAASAGGRRSDGGGALDGPDPSAAQRASGDPAALVRRYEQLRREHAKREAADAPAIIAANQAQLSKWVERMRADRAARSSGGPPLPRTACGAAPRSGGGSGAAARSADGASGGRGPTSGGGGGDDDGGDDEDDSDSGVSGDAGAASDSDSSYDGARNGRHASKRRKLGQPAGAGARGGSLPPPQPPPRGETPRAAAAADQEEQGNQGEGAQLPLKGGAGVSTREVKHGRYKTHVLPVTKRLPQYCSWEFLLRNELARDEGRRMYYIDETGETVPASDDEDDRHYLPWDSAEGPSHDYALLELLAEEGDGPEVIGALAEHLEVQEEWLMKHVGALRVPPRRRDGDIWQGDFGGQAAVLEAAFCRRCCLYNCRRHAAGHVKPAARPPPPPPAGADDPPCSGACWRAAGPGGGGAAAAAAAGEGAPWTPYDLGVVQQAVKLLGWDACQVALTLDPSRFTCAEVKRRLDELRGEEEASEEEGDGGGKAGGRRGNWRRKKKMMQQQGKAARKAVLLRRYNNNSEEHGWPAYTPCDCVGPCKAGECSCIDSANFCEKFCGCCAIVDAKCRFEGCNCKTRCRTTRCSCLMANRECDPDRCKGCAPTCDGGAAPGTECCNMNLRLRRRKKVVMSLSATHGWGAFLAEDASKGDFIGEYVGDLLGQDEADRRGRIYDKMDSSYLFNVNQLWVIDARRRGNKLRFANHSTRPNCAARVMQVDGDHRVAIFAAEDIKRGGELLYNYRYDLDNAPDWALTN